MALSCEIDSSQIFLFLSLEILKSFCHTYMANLCEVCKYIIFILFIVLHIFNVTIPGETIICADYAGNWIIVTTHVMSHGIKNKAWHHGTLAVFGETVSWTRWVSFPTLRQISLSWAWTDFTRPIFLLLTKFSRHHSCKINYIITYFECATSLGLVYNLLHGRFVLFPASGH